MKWVLRIISGLVDEERYAGETGKAILAVVEAVRTGRDL